MRYKLLETTNLLGKFPTGGSITIALYDINTSASVTLTSASCTEIGTTGVFKWNTDRITTYPTSLSEYLWTMTNGSATSYGKIVLGGYPDAISSASTIWTYPTREITSGGTSASAVAIAVWDELLSTHTAAGTAGSALIISRDILNTPVDGIYTLEEVIQIMVAVLAGKLSGDTNTLTFRDLSDTINRITVTVNNLAERTGITINV